MTLAYGYVKGTLLSDPTLKGTHRGALMVDVGQPEWVAYFAAFDQQLVPTDALGNPTANAEPIGTAGGNQ
jgi:uncharacterized protein YukJ